MSRPRSSRTSNAQCESSDALVEPIKVAIAKVLDAARDDEYVTVIGDFRVAKIFWTHGVTYPDVVRGSKDDVRLPQHMACGAHWAAERIAVVYLNTRALASDAAQSSAAVSPF